MSKAKVKFWADDPRSIWEYASQLEKQHAPRIGLDMACLRLRHARPNLGDRDIDRLSGQLKAITAFESFRRQGYNLTREVFGGALAMLVRPMQTKFIPVGGDGDLMTACEQLTQLNDGILEANRSFELYQRVVEDALACSVGAAKSYVDAKGEVRVGWVDPLNLFWDMGEGDDPMTLIEVHAMPRRRALAMWPKHAEAIKAAEQWAPKPVPGVEHLTTTGPKSDTIKVIEATVPKMGDLKGKKVIAINKTLVNGTAGEDYLFERHMIAVFRWENDFRSFGGISLARGVAPYHAWTNKLVATHYKALCASVPIVWVHEDEELFKSMNDLEMQIQRFSGTKPPEVTVPATVSQDVVEQINYLRERCYQENGVNFAVSTGQKPVGLVSAPGQREHLETANLRLFPQQKRFERFCNDVSMNNACLASTTYQKNEARISAPGSRYIRTMKWGDMPLKDLTESKYEARTAATSGLSLTVAGRLDDLSDLQKLGVVDGEEVAEHLNIPDGDSLRKLKTSPRRLAEKMCDDALKRGINVVPSPQQDLHKLMSIATLRLQDAKESGIYKAKNVQLLRRLIRNTEALLKPLAPPAPPPVAAPPELSTLPAISAAPIASPPLA